MNFYKKNKRIVWAFIILIFTGPFTPILNTPYEKIFLSIIAIIILTLAKKRGENKKLIILGYTIASISIAINAFFLAYFVANIFLGNPFPWVG